MVVVLAHQRSVAYLDVEVGEQPRLAHDARATELGMLDVDEDVARQQMGIGRDGLVRHHRHRRHARGLEHLERLARRPRPGPCGDRVVDLRRRGAAGIGGGVARHQLFAVEHRAQARPLGFIADRNGDPVVLACGGIHVVRREGAVAVADPDRPWNPELVGEERVRCAGGDDLPRRQVDVLTFARARPVQQRGEHADCQRASAPVVGRLADLRRWTIGVAGLLGQPAGRTEDAGETGRHRVRAGGAVRRRGHDDELRSLREERLGVETEPRHDARTEVVDDDVGPLREPVCERTSRGLGEVDLERPLAEIELVEVR